MRAVRQWLTARATDAALTASPWLPPVAMSLIEGALARGGRFLPYVNRIVADNMRALGVYSPEAHRDYFARIAAHMSGSLHIFRCADPRRSAELAQIVAQRVRLDESIETLRCATAGGRGAIVMTVHMVDLLLVMARFNQVLPTTVHLRHSKDARRRQAKERWCAATGLEFIAEPHHSDAPHGRLFRMADVLRAGRVLMISPDLPQKLAERSERVNFFDRLIRFPAGAVLLALRTGAPLMTLVAQPEDGAVCATLRGPFEPRTPRRGTAGREQALRAGLQWFADCLADFIRQSPALWYMWGDKRWTRVLRGDTRYVEAVACADASSHSILDSPAPAAACPPA